MSKDKRVKGCPNQECAKATSKAKYKSDEHYCVNCGSELVFVCAKCHGPLDDEGPGHRVCAGCEAAAEDRKERAFKNAKAVGAAVGGFATIAVGILVRK